MTTLLLAALLLVAPPNPPVSSKVRPNAPKAQAASPDCAARDDQPQDWIAEYVEYRCLPDLGLITVSDGVVRGRKPVEHLRANSKALAARGIFGCTDAARRSHHRTDHVAGHRFETLVAITPPADEDGDWTRRVTVLVDGRRKVDCSIGSSSDNVLFVYGVTIFPEDGTVEIAAVNADGKEVFPPAEFERIDHAGVITDATLQPDTGEEDATPMPLDRA